MDVAFGPKWFKNDLYEPKFKLSEGFETEIRDLSVAWEDKSVKIICDAQLRHIKH